MDEKRAICRDRFDNSPDVQERKSAIKCQDALIDGLVDFVAEFDRQRTVAAGEQSGLGIHLQLKIVIEE